MKDRRGRLARAAQITRTLWRLQQMRLARVEAEISVLRAAERATVEALDRIDPALILGRLAFLAARRLEAEQAASEMRVLAREHGRRAKLAENLHDKVDAHLRGQEAVAELRRLAAKIDVSAP